jgi:hypothetical protein
VSEPFLPVVNEPRWERMRDGRVLAAKYGKYVDDQWSVEELLDLAKAARHMIGASPAPTGATTTPTTQQSVARAQSPLEVKM